ncbi:MAG: HIT family protein [Oscillospiraceae bacterium]|nr:HIT family protein [Oscillospiraceae bacterium]
MKHDCDFCKIAAGLLDCKKVYEDDRAVAFLDYDPISTGHMLLISKVHVPDADLLPEEDAVHLMKVSRRLIAAMKKAFPCDGYTVMQNGGDFNDLNHYHMHIFPRHHGDGFGWVDGGLPQECSDEVAEKIKACL